MFIGRAQRARTSELNGNFVCMYVCLLGERSEPVLVNSMAILFVCMYASTDRGQCACVPAQRANVAGLASSARCARPQMLCILLVCHQPTAVSAHASPRNARKQSRPCLFRSLRSPTNALHSPSMSSTDRDQCACVTAQRANVAGLASSAHCGRPQMLCILLVCHQPTAVSAHASPRNAQT